MKKILVPTDFSNEANNALKVAAQLAKKFDSDIYLLHMLELPEGVGGPGSGVSSPDSVPEALYFMKMAHKRFEDIKDEPYLKGIDIYETVMFKEAFKGILEVGKQNECDLVVMGSHGATGLKEVFIGSNTEKVVRHSEIPVLVIKGEAENFTVKDFVYACDFVPHVKKPFLEATEFAQIMDAKMHLVYINTANKFKTSEYLDSITSEFLKDVPFKNYTMNVYNADSVERGILKFAAKKNADLIGISTHGRKGLAHFLNGSISEDLVNHAKRPVVTFKI